MIVSPIQIFYCIISYIRLDCVICFMNFSYFLYSSWLFAIPQAKTHIFKLRLLLIETSIVQSVTKFMGKTGIWTTSCSYPISPFNNVKKHCIGGGGGSNTLSKIPIIFCHWMSEIYNNNKRWGTMHAVSNNIYPL